MYKPARPSMERIHLSHYGHIPANLEYPSISVAEMMLENCNKYHNFQALKYTQGGITHSETYTEYAENIELTAKMFKIHGVEKGDKIMALSPYLPEEYHTKYASSAVGAVLVPLHPNQVKVRQKMINLLKQVKPKIIVCTDACVPYLDEIITNNKYIDDMIERVLYYSPVDSIKKKGLLSIINPIIDNKYKKSGKGPESLKTTSTKFASFNKERELVKNYKGTYMENVTGEDDHVIYFSSGTSGKEPSGSIHTNNSCNSLLISGKHICDCIEPGQKLIIVPGPFHCFGSETGRNTLVNSGVTQIIIPDPRDLNNLAETQKREKAEIQINVPLMLTKMKESKKFDDISYDNVELFISGGGKLSLDTSKYWNAKLPEGRGIREGYGLSQTNGGICINLKYKQIPGTIGIPLPDNYFMLKDVQTGEIITKPNTPGELYIASPSLMRGILNDTENKSLIKDEEGVTWYKTNDLVSFDENGWYKFFERIDDVMNLSNSNLVNPNEIRNVLEKFSIENSIIFNTNDHPKSDGKDRIILCIEYSGEDEDLSLLKEVLQKAFSLYLKNYEIPEEIIIFDELPMNLNGKFLKKETKEKYFQNEYVKKLVLK